jgi:AraC family transcriptional regulator, ethanolamine operon transcriptional activator
LSNSNRETGGAASSVWGVEYAELEELEAAVRGWRVRFTPLASGLSTGSLRECLLASLRLVQVRFTGPVALSSRPIGEAPPFQVGLISPAPDRLLWDGRPVHFDRLMVKEGGEGSNFALPGHCEFTVARLDRDQLGELLRVFRAGESEPPRFAGTYPLSGLALYELRSRLGALLRLDPAQSPDLVVVAERDIYQRVALALSNGPDAARPSPAARRRVLRTAEEYIRSHTHDRLSLADLCRASGCSERTLRSAFQEHYGVSPLAFIKRVRLLGLRGDLLDASPRSARVIDLALRWGFWHLGHLSRDYRRLFGETPIETLTRRPAFVRYHSPASHPDAAA